MRFVICFSLALAAYAQPAFTLVSVKHSPNPGANPKYVIHADGLDLTNFPLINLITRAYGLPAYRVSGPNWIATEKYDFSGTATDRILPQQVWNMFQPILADRFHMATHRETKMIEGYSLQIARSGLKIQPVEKQTPPPRQQANSDSGLRPRQVSMLELAARLETLLACPVDDATHREGFFDVDIRWTPDNEQLPGRPLDAQPAESSGSSLFDVLEEQLGLKLQKHKVSAEMLVVDHIDKTPAGN